MFLILSVTSDNSDKFSMVLPHRPRSLQRKSKTDKYRQTLRNLAINKMMSVILKGPLYSRITWLHRQHVTTDVDNIVKPILDALEGVVFGNDFEICQALATRIDLRRDYTIVAAGASAEDYEALVDLLDRGEDDILYVEVGRMEAERVVFGPIDGGER
jgi:Holliday junction resolvase RusA-like endonuclease